MSKIIVDKLGTPHSLVEGVEPTFDVFATWIGNRRMVLASNDGDLFNPSNIDHVIHQRDKERGGLFWRLRNCSEECYRNYTVFLRSKNNVPYNLAQRRFRNDF